MTGGYVHRTRDERLRNWNSGCMMPAYLTFGATAIVVLVAYLMGAK